ncbi:MAG: hypothetical protein U0R19_23720 [Bryobacteraceae bacterium]
MTLFGSLAFGQAPQSTVLTVEMENVVQYQENFANLAKNGTSTGMEPSIGVPAPFSPGYFIADIVAINGKRCKGTTVARNIWLGLNPNATGNQAVADVLRNQAMEIALEIQQADGTAVGGLFLTGLTAGGPPPGAPRSAPTGTFAIVGGTGAYLGARGQAATIQQAGRFTSTQENPVNRRTFAAGQWRMAIQLIPMVTPQVLSEGNIPMVYHASDGTLVSSAKPARAGETLTLYASGLGPTRPGVDPGQVFPDNPTQTVSAPVEVLVNGKSGEVLGAKGYPNTVDAYEVSFRVPADVGTGSLPVQLSAGWVLSGKVEIAVQ